MKPLLIELLQGAGLRYYQVSTGNKDHVKARLTTDGFQKWLHYRQDQIKKAHCSNSGLKKNI